MIVLLTIFEEYELNIFDIDVDSFKNLLKVF